jgi:hypothetical protein
MMPKKFTLSLLQVRPIRMIAESTQSFGAQKASRNTSSKCPPHEFVYL